MVYRIKKPVAVRGVYMKWTRVSDELPPLNTEILLCNHINKEGKMFCWDRTIVTRPYNSDKKYNPDYYEYKPHQLPKGLKMDDYWMVLTAPVREGER